MKNGIELEGKLFKLNRNGLTLEQKNGALKTLQFNSNLLNFQLRKKHQITKGIFIGALTGLIIGCTSGFLSGDDRPSLFSHTAKDKAGIYGVLGFLLGGISGGKYAAAKIKITLNGSTSLSKQQLNYIKLKKLHP